jgi:hypothetical protein
MNKFHGKRGKGIKEEVKSDSKIKSEIETALKTIFDKELQAAKQNLDDVFSKGDDYYDMVHCVRKKKQFDDEFNVYIPEFLARLLTQIGNFCSQYFSSRDYVDNYLESEDPKDVAESKASKKLINEILNIPELHFYHKVVRLMMSVFSKGYGILKGSYKQKVEQVIIGYEDKEDYVQDENGNYLDIDGMPYQDPYVQEPATTISQVPQFGENVVEDRPDFDFYPNRDVFFSPEFTYTLADKKYVIFREEGKSYEELEEDKEKMGYFNLEILKSKARKEKQSEDGKTIYEICPSFTLYERYGKGYVIVDEKDENGKPIEVSPGIDEDGKPLKNAELVDLIQTTASWEKEGTKNRELIRYQVSPFSKIPAIRFICYVDEIYDTGFGDGESLVGLQGAVNDNFNLAFYRTSLATKPFFKGLKWAGIPEKIHVHSENVTLLEDMNALEEFQINDNPQGAMVMHQGLSNQFDRVTGAAPPMMGDSTDRRETATMGSIMQKNASIRMGLKNLNFEFIGFTEFYNMILSLVNDFMLPQTLEGILGELAFVYNPKRKDKFKPVTQALETEEGKQFKIKMWDMIASKIAPMGAFNPKTPMVMNYILGQVLELMGGSFKAFKPFMFEEDPKKILEWLMLTGNKGMMMSPPQASGNPNPAQNQTGLPMTPQEQMPRGM